MFRHRKLCSTSSPTQGNQVAYEETCDHWAKVTSPYLYVAFIHVYCYAWTTSIRGQGSSWKSHWEWQEREINGEGMSIVWPTLWSRTAKEPTHLFHSSLSGWAGIRKVKPVWILLNQETVSGSGISWAICKSAPRSRQITMPAPHQSVFTGRMPFLPPNQQPQSTEG